MSVIQGIRRWYPALSLVVMGSLLLAALLAAIWATHGMPWDAQACASSQIHPPAYGPWVVLACVAMFLVGSRVCNDRHTGEPGPAGPESVFSRIVTVAILAVITGFLGFETISFAAGVRPITWYIRCVEVASPLPLKLVTAGAFISLSFLAGHWFAAWPVAGVTTAIRSVRSLVRRPGPPSPGGGGS